MKINLHNAEFLRSAASAEGFPRDGLPQIVFAGRSNVGKSSVLNMLLNRKSFARVSAAPGKTANINLYLIDKKFYFVDLPGYGYAKVSQAERARWGRLMEDYFKASGHITLGVSIVDIRHKPTGDDKMMKEFFVSAGISFAVFANKADKLKKSAITESIEVIRNELSLDEKTALFPVSAVTGEGKSEALSLIFAAAGAE